MVAWILSELGYPQPESTVLGEGNMSTITMINKNCNGKKTKHIDIGFNLIREQAKLLKIALQHLPNTQNMISDNLTEPLDPKPWQSKGCRFWILVVKCFNILRGLL